MLLARRAPRLLPPGLRPRLGPRRQPGPPAQAQASMAGEPRSPPVKVLAAQLRPCRRAPGGSWLLGREEAGQAPLAVAVVWMQGTVLAVEAGGSAARLQDERPFTVLGVERVPKGRPCLSAGKYVMVMGLVHSCSPEPIVRAVKMTDLSDNPIHRSMWRFEVEDLHRNIS